MTNAQAYTKLAEWAAQSREVKCKGFIGDCQNTVIIFPAKRQFSQDGYCLKCIEDMGKCE